MSTSYNPWSNEPPPAPVSYARPALWFLVGMAVFGVVVMIYGMMTASFMSGPRGPTAIIAAGVLLLITAAAAGIALWRKRIALGSGLLVGYAIATAFSSGQCTLWAASGPDYAWLQGFVVYIMALGALLVATIVAAVVDAVRR